MSESVESAVESIGGVLDVSAKKDGSEATISYDFGASLAEVTERYGEDVVFGKFLAQCKIDLQAVMRRYLTAGKDCAELTGIWKPGITLERIADPKASMKNAFTKMSEEEKKAIIAELKASL